MGINPAIAASQPHLCPRKPVGGGPYHGSKLSVNGSGLWSDDFDVTTTIKR